MKKALIVVITLLGLSSLSFAQSGISIGLHSGLLLSAFEDQEKSGTAIPLGANVGLYVAENIQIGAEFSFLVSSFEAEFEEFQGQPTNPYDLEVTQTAIGAFGRYILPTSGVKSYIKAGIGMYMGEAEASGGVVGEEDFESAFGFNIGGGIKTAMGIYAEFVFHIVSRELDVAGVSSQGYNNWGFLVGYDIPLN